MASPYRETEAMLDGSDAIADWPLLNALVNTAAGASWVSIHNGGGVGIGYSQHAGMVVVADGTEACGRRLERVLTTDPGLGVIRHADAGYESGASSRTSEESAMPMDPGEVSKLAVIGTARQLVTLAGPRAPAHRRRNAGPGNHRRRRDADRGGRIQKCRRTRARSKRRRATARSSTRAAEW